MNVKVNELLELFIKISGEKHNLIDLLDELNRFDRRIPELSTRLASLKDSISDEKYFDASSEIIDRNIELSLQKKLDYLNTKLKSLKEKNETIIAERKAEEERFSKLNKTLASCQAFIYDLSKYDNDIASSNIQKLIDMENERFDTVSDEINNKKEERNRTISSSNAIYEEIAHLEKIIQTEEDRLKEVKNSLKSKNSYINEEEKADDLKQIENIENEIKDMNKRRTEIVNSVTYQSYLIKEELEKMNPDKDKILEITRMIAEKLNDLPYLSVEDDTILDEEYNQLNSRKDELTAVIENKKYNIRNRKPYEIRLEYINQKINNAKDIKEDYESLLRSVLNKEIESIVDNLLKLKTEKKELENNFTGNSKSELQRKFVDELIQSYESDLTSVLDKARDIKGKIVAQENEIEIANAEIKEINSSKKYQFDLENQAEKEQDNKMLQDIVEKISYLNNRIEAGTTPNQIYDQMEMLLYSNDKKEESYEDSPVIKNYDKDDDYSFEKVDKEKVPNYSDEEMIISPDKYIEAADDTKEFSFSPIDNTGYVSFDDAYDIAK